MPQRMVVVMVIAKPINDSYGINFKRSLIDTFVAPAVEWKNDP